MFMSFVHQCRKCNKKKNWPQVNVLAQWNVRFSVVHPQIDQNKKNRMNKMNKTHLRAYEDTTNVHTLKQIIRIDILIYDENDEFCMRGKFWGDFLFSAFR